MTNIKNTVYPYS